MLFTNYDDVFHVGLPQQGEDIGTVLFSGGEVHISLRGPNQKFSSATKYGSILIKARLYNSDAIMRLIMLRDAITRTYGPVDVDLYMPYVPYARADRAMPGGGGDALGIKAFSDIINNLNFRQVFITDPHSNVTEAVLNRCVTLHLEDNVFFSVSQMEDDSLVVVAPDVGAIKRAQKAAGSRSFPLVSMDKRRDQSTGRILGVRLLDELPKGRTPVIVDDICDGGRTFIEAAKVLRANGARKVILCVTHGIFSNGFDELKKYITRIYTTNSIKELQTDSFLKVENVF